MPLFRLCSSARKTSCCKRWCARPSCIREQLGSAGQVIGFRVNERLAREGIWRAESARREIDEDEDDGAAKDRESLKWMTRRGAASRQAKEIDDLRRDA